MEFNMKQFLGAFVGVLAAIGLVNVFFPAPNLVGYGCEGASAPIYAYEESDFPVCVKIETR